MSPDYITISNLFVIHGKYIATAHLETQLLHVDGKFFNQSYYRVFLHLTYYCNVQYVYWGLVPFKGFESPKYTWTCLPQAHLMVFQLCL